VLPKVLALLVAQCSREPSTFEASLLAARGSLLGRQRIRSGGGESVLAIRLILVAVFAVRFVVLFLSDDQQEPRQRQRRRDPRGIYDIRYLTLFVPSHRIAPYP
jgi:hypothetical protein